MGIPHGISAPREDGRIPAGGFLPPWVRNLIRRPRSVRVTREGKWYIAAVLVTGAIAVNTGNNLLYLVLATLLSIVILSGIMSELTMRGLTITRVLPRRLYRGAPFPASIRILNRKRLIPSLCFRVYELPCRGLPDTHLYVVRTGAGERHGTTLTNAFTERGLMELRGFKITTTFPFGLFLKSRVIEHREKVLVYPAMKPVGRVRVAAGPMSRSGSSTNARGSGTGLYNIRAYTQNDDARHIHWKSAARSSSLMLKEYEQETEKSVIISFKNLSQEGADQAFEDAVDEAACIAGHFIERGWAVGLETLSGSLTDARGDAQLYRILEFLALIAPAGRGVPSIQVHEA